MYHSIKQNIQSQEKESEINQFLWDLPNQCEHLQESRERRGKRVRKVLKARGVPTKEHWFKSILEIENGSAQIQRNVFLKIN